MSSQPRVPYQSVLVAELQRELPITRRLLERVPAEQFGWQPHPKSMSLGALAAHMANLIGFLDMAVQGPETDVEAVAWPAPPTTTDELLQRFDVNGATIQTTLAALADAEFHGLWALRRGEQILMQLPRVAVVRTFVLNHLIHHRGQLSVYLRLLDIPVPAIYGNSADEAPGRK
jgi:uncharacterized damage-inducible protein DinB